MRGQVGLNLNGLKFAKFEQKVTGEGRLVIFVQQNPKTNYFYQHI